MIIEKIMDSKLVYSAAGILCLVAVLPLPYGFYTFLRFVVTAGGFLAAIQLRNENNVLWVIFAGICILFNPFIPVYLDKGIWFPIDLAVSGAFGWLFFKEKKN